ncbi:hypothetical protein DFJ67_6769 [Asanoa ferruginea]|uniref:Uncharacterized protein n=1 Tax=Asanoa ferruginea TaxID=53367 RepID=A0A3D9ZTY5_9ACTN|nr:hypothetical protein DFJ67_6769 [Asanoa ferruginea]GIF47414.1 hypothetical protein Afe04nite_19530 [Asanoa ferruginea]
MGRGRKATVAVPIFVAGSPSVAFGAADTGKWLDEFMERR